MFSDPHMEIADSPKGQMPGDSRVEESDHWAGIRADDAKKGEKIHGIGKNLTGDSMYLPGNCKSRNIVIELDRQPDIRLLKF